MSNEHRRALIAEIVATIMVWTHIPSLEHLLWYIRLLGCLGGPLGVGSGDEGEALGNRDHVQKRVVRQVLNGVDELGDGGEIGRAHV